MLLFKSAATFRRMDPFGWRIATVAGRPYRQYVGATSSAGLGTPFNDKPEPLIPVEDALLTKAGIVKQEAEPLLEDSQIRQENGLFVAQFACDTEVFPHLIGKQGAARIQIEEATGATLTFPTKRDSAGMQASDVLLQAASKQALSSAYFMLKQSFHTVISAPAHRAGLDYNAFVSIPIANELTQKWAQQFKTYAQSLEPDAYDDSLFNRPERLHITVCMLKLFSDEARQHASEILSGLHHQIVGQEGLLAGNPLRVKLQALDIMNGTPEATNVLYAKVHDPSGTVQKLCDLLLKAYVQEGFISPKEARPTKLHVTLMNTRYFKGAKRGPRPSINVKRLLETADQLQPAEVLVPAIHVSHRPRFDPVTGYYMSISQLPLPQVI